LLFGAAAHTLTTVSIIAMFSDCLYYVSHFLHNTAYKAHRKGANMAVLWVSHIGVTHSQRCHNTHAPLLSLSTSLVRHTRQKWQPSSPLNLFSFLMACLRENTSSNPLYDGPPYRMLNQIGMCL
jgi:hypothetical protein